MRHVTMHLLPRWVVCTMLLLPMSAWSAGVVTVRAHGDPANRVDLAILGDGYTGAEMDKYAADVEALLAQFFAQEPFKEYQHYVNVHRVDVISNESGIDHPHLGIFKDTALDGRFNCNGIERLICVNNSKAFGIATDRLPATHRDLILVIVNDPTYGGSGGALAVISTHSSVVELALHELGHTFGLLADEYDYGPPACNNAVEPVQPNVTRASGFPIKWDHWIDPGTPIPTTGVIYGVPGLYQGARYCAEGLFRPTFDSKMFSLFRPFEQINTEQLVKRFYNWVSPLDTFTPADLMVSAPQGASLAFGITTPEPLTGPLPATWFVDGHEVGSGHTFILDTSSYAPGTYPVEVRIEDPTPWVRLDPAGVLRERHTWQVTITPAIPPSLTLQLNRTTFRPGQTMTLSLHVAHTGADVPVDLYLGLLLPDGTTMAFLTPHGIDLVPFPGNPATWPAVLSHVTVPAGLEVILDAFAFTWPSADFAGHWIWVGFMTPPGALQDGIIDDGDVLVLDIRPFMVHP